MGNCNERKSPENPYSPDWKRCGYYNDWISDPNFCMPPTSGGDIDVSFCNNIGGENEWRVRTPSYQQNSGNFINGGGNTPIQINQAINRISIDPSDVSARRKASETTFNSDKFSDMLNTNIDVGLYKPSGNKDMGPLYATDVDGKPVPLWDGFLNNRGYVSELPQCTYDSWRKNGVQTVGCCSKGYDSCGIVGGINISCIRNDFAGNSDTFGDISCCFNDLVCEAGADEADRPFAPAGQDGQKTPWANNAKCFRSGRDNDYRTCNPESRNLGGSYCGDAIKDYCTGKKLFPGQANWIEAWDESVTVNVNEADEQSELLERSVNVNGPCIKMMMRQISGKGACGQDFDNFTFNVGNSSDSGLLWASDVMEGVFEKYFEEFGSPLLGPNEDGLEASIGGNDFLYNMCKKMPLLCVNPLTRMCSQMTEEKIANNPLANKWCGCYMPEEEYAKYSSGSFLVSPECTPFCSQSDTIPRVNSEGNPKFCEQSICVINDVSLKLAETKGNIDFNQVCPRCARSQNSFSVDGTTTTQTSGGKTLTNSVTNTNSETIASSCQCKLDGINLTSLDAKFKNLNLADNCGGSQCTDSEGNTIACSSNKNEILTKVDNTLNKIKLGKSSSKFKKMLIIFIVIILLGGLMAFLFVYRKRFFHSRKGFISVKSGQKFNYNKQSLV